MANVCVCVNSNGWVGGDVRTEQGQRWALKMTPYLVVRCVRIYRHDAKTHMYVHVVLSDFWRHVYLHIIDKYWLVTRSFFPPAGNSRPGVAEQS